MTSIVQDVIEPDVDRRGRLGDPPDRNVIDPGFRDGANSVEPNPTRRFERHSRGDQCHGGTQFIVGHIVEVDRIEQVEPALGAGADRLLLDNMTNDQLRAAVALVAGRVPLEASGGVRLDTIRGIAETGVNYISVGRITQSAPAVDIGLDYILNN